MTVSIGSPILDTSLYIPDLKYKRRDAVLQQMLDRALAADALSDATLVGATLAMRERAGGSGIGKGVAIPNARSIGVRRACLVVGRATRGLDWSADTDAPVTLVLLALSTSETSEDAHHAFLARVASAVRLQRQRQKLLEAESFEDVAAVLREVTA